MERFKDRWQAGERLAEELRDYQALPGAVVLGLARGGVVTAAAVAKRLRLPLDVICPRKISAHNNPEYAIGAVTESGEAILRNNIGVSESYIAEAIITETAEARRRLKIYREGMPPRKLNGKTAILIDDGLATGSTMCAAIQGVRAEGAHEVVVAVPVTPPHALGEMYRRADAVFCVSAPRDFYAVGQFYESFPQSSDEEVYEILHQVP